MRKCAKCGGRVRVGFAVCDTCIDKSKSEHTADPKSSPSNLAVSPAYRDATELGFISTFEFLRYLVGEIGSGASFVLKGKLRKAESDVEALITEMALAETFSENEERLFKSKWKLFVHYLELESFPSPELAYAMVEYHRNRLLKMPSGAAVRRLIETASRARGWELEPSSPSLPIDAHLWCGLRCRAVSCNSPRVTRYDVFCESHSSLLSHGHPIELKDAQPDKQPTALKRLQPYADLYAILRCYQAPYCNRCNQINAKGLYYPIGFSYATRSGSPTTQTTVSTKPGRAKAYLCQNCISDLEQRAERRRWGIHFPISVLVAVIITLASSRALAAGSAGGIGIGLCEIAIYMTILGDRLKLPSVCGRAAWKSFKNKALANGAAMRVEQNGQVLLLENAKVW